MFEREGSQAYYELLEEGVIEEGRTIIAVGDKDYMSDLGGFLCLVSFDRLIVRPESILEGKKWFIKE